MELAWLVILALPGIAAILSGVGRYNSGVGAKYTGRAEYLNAQSNLHFRLLDLKLAGPPYTLDKPRMGKTYPVGIVGEASYQTSIRRCDIGQRVRILHEPDNPYDREALAVVTESGETLGYIARDCWLQSAIHEEGRACEASIKEISSAGAGKRGVIIDVELRGRGVGTRAFGSAPTVTVQPKGWLSRLFGL